MSLRMPVLLGGEKSCGDWAQRWPPADGDIWTALSNAYLDGSWGQYQGRHVRHLEARLAEFFEVNFVLGCASGTFALELAMRALRLKPGDEVIMAAYEFAGNIQSAAFMGLRPVLIDVDANNWNLDVFRLKPSPERSIRALIVSHLHGGLVRMQELMEFAAENGLLVIEDAAQVPGAFVQGRRAGTWGDIGVISFGGSKLLTAGRGGAVMTNNSDVYSRLREFASRGSVVAPMSELQAAVLLPQLERLDARNAIRRIAVEALTERLSVVPGLHPIANKFDCQPAYYKWGIQFEAEEFELSRERLVTCLRAEGLPINSGYRNGSLRLLEKNKRENLSEAIRADRGMVVLHHSALLADTSQVDQVVEAIEKVYDQRNILRC